MLPWQLRLLGQGEATQLQHQPPALPKGPSRCSVGLATVCSMGLCRAAIKVGALLNRVRFIGEKPGLKTGLLLMGTKWLILPLLRLLRGFRCLAATALSWLTRLFLH